MNKFSSANRRDKLVLETDLPADSVMRTCVKLNRWDESYRYGLFNAPQLLRAAAHYAIQVAIGGA